MTGDHRDIWRQGRAQRIAGYVPRHLAEKEPGFLHPLVVILGTVVLFGTWFALSFL